MRCKNKHRLSKSIRRAIDNHVFMMVLSAPDYDYGPENYENFATSIHNLVCRTKKFGKDAMEYQTMRLREVLSERGIATPAEGDFVYFGGRCFVVRDLFADDATRKETAAALAKEIVDSVDTVDRCTVEQVADALAESAALDEEMLAMRTAAMVPLLNKEHPDCGVDEYFGNFTILPDGSLLSMHYLYTA